MIEPHDYVDRRSGFWQRCYGRALDYDAYLAESPVDQADRWGQMSARIPPLSEAEQARVRGFPPRLLNLLVVSGVWCGDCVRQGPMLRNIVMASEGTIEMRLMDRDADPELRDEVRIIGAMRVPVAVFLTESFLEVARVGDRMLSTYRRKADSEIGAACPVPYGPLSSEELGTEQSEWLDVVERLLLMTRLSPAVQALLVARGGSEERR